MGGVWNQGMFSGLKVLTRIDSTRVCVCVLKLNDHDDKAFVQ